MVLDVNLLCKTDLEVFEVVTQSKDDVRIGLFERLELTCRKIKWK